MASRLNTQPAANELLHTKLTLPRLRPVRVLREHLLTRLDEGLNYKLTLLSAPAGFGKSTLVTEWIASRRDQGDLPSVAWVSLDEGDNDPVRFWRYVFSACQSFATPAEESVGEIALSLLRRAQHPSFEMVLTTFINDLMQIAHPSILVLEDYHVIHAQQIHEMVAFLIDYVPSTLHLILITRREPPLPLARLRAQHEIYELRAADLRFSPAETQAFLQQNVPFSLPSTAVTLLNERTEGWVAGLQLVTLTLQRYRQPQEVADFLKTFSGSQREILDYLAEEVLAAQPDSLQAFLLRTSVLQRLTASLCNVLTDRDDSGVTLEQLERANLFLLPLDGTQKWYRYHPLFAEAMQQVARRRIGEAELLELHKRASLWYEENGYRADAVETALAAQDYAHAADLIARTIASKRENRELHTVRRWIEQLPSDLLYERPDLCLSYAMAILFTSDRSAPETLAMVQEPLQKAEDRWLADENEPQLGQLFAFRSMVFFWQGDFTGAFAAARHALDLLPEQDFYWRGTSLFHAALETILAGRINEARPMILEARSLWERAGNYYGTRAATIILGEICIEQGELHQARHLLQHIFDEAGDDRLDQCHALIGLSMLAYEWDDLESAQEYAAQALQISMQHAADLGENLAEETLIVPASLLLARVEQARGDLAQSQERLQALPPTSAPSPLLRTDVRDSQTRLALAMGDVAAAERWCSRIDEDAEQFPLQQEREARRSARVRIASGRAHDALRLLEPWRKDARMHGRVGSEVATLSLMALAHFAQDDYAQAREAIVRSLTLAQPGQYQRLFLDEGELMATLLQTVYPDVRHLPVSTHIRKLLFAFAEEPSTLSSAPAADVPLLIEPLSAQEERVLRLLSAGLSNPEIAQEQVVSVNTIKSQVQSIYRKLDVHSREEAVDVARQLGLI